MALSPPSLPPSAARLGQDSCITPAVTFPSSLLVEVEVVVSVSMVVGSGGVVPVFGRTVTAVPLAVKK